MRSGEYCVHGHEGGLCPDKDCPGYWRDADDPTVEALLDDVYAEALLGDPPEAENGHPETSA